MFWKQLEEAGRKLASRPMEDLNYEFPPLYHATGRAGCTICLGKDGTLHEIIMHDKPQPIVYPVTEPSMKRTISPEKSPHGLCEQAGIAKEKPYLIQLSHWAEASGNDFLQTIVSYVREGTLFDDVTAAGGDAKTMIRWQVGAIQCWNNEKLMESWISFYSNQVKANALFSVDMVTGKTDTIATTHPKATLPGHGNGKFISAGDKTEFTWRGFFAVPEEALTVSVASSHYAHQAIKYLALHNGVSIGNGDTLMIWSPVDPAAKVSPNLWYTDPENPLPFAWEDGFLANYRNHLSIPEHVRNAPLITMICGGATTGRNCTKFYEEGDSSTYLDAIAHWRYKTGWEINIKGSSDPQPFFPSIDNMIDFAFGHMEGNKMTASGGMKTSWQKRLMLAMLRDKPLPETLVSSLVARCVTHGIYGYMICPVTLACLRKKYIDETGEVYDPMLNEETRDRSYLFGRLLAWYEAFERASFNPGETRATTAERRRAYFFKKPLEEARKLEEKSLQWKRKMARYNRRLVSWYSKNIEEMWDTIGSDNGAELEPSFLFGYNAQKRTIYTKREDRE